MKIFVEADAWLAIIDSENPSHEAFKNYFKSALEQGDKFYTTNVIVGNVITQLKEVGQINQANEFYQIMEEAWLGTYLHALWLSRRTFKDAMRLFEKSESNRLSMFDCANIVLMNRRNINQIMTGRRDYSVAGFTAVPENPE